MSGALAVTSLERAPLLPDVPPMAEFLPGFEATSWHGLFAPAARRPRSSTSSAPRSSGSCSSPQMQAQVAGHGRDAVGNTPEEFAAIHRRRARQVGEGDHGREHHDRGLSLAQGGTKMTRKKPEELRSHRWFGVHDLRAFGHRSRIKQMG